MKNTYKLKWFVFFFRFNKVKAKMKKGALLKRLLFYISLNSEIISSEKPSKIISIVILKK